MCLLKDFKKFNNYKKGITTCFDLLLKSKNGALIVVSNESKEERKGITSQGGKTRTHSGESILTIRIGEKTEKMNLTSNLTILTQSLIRTCRSVAIDLSLIKDRRAP